MFKIENKDYDIKSFAKHYGISQKNAIKILLENAKFDKNALEQAIATLGPNKEITINGVTYRSLEQAARMHHITKTILVKNLKRFGYKTDLVFKDPKSVKDYILAGKHFDSLYHAAHYIGIPYYQIGDRIKKYGTDDPRILIIDNASSPNTFKLGEFTFRSVQQALNLLGYQGSRQELVNNQEKVLDPNRDVDPRWMWRYIPTQYVDEFQKLIKNSPKTVHHYTFEHQLNDIEKVKLGLLLDFYRKKGFLK